MADATATITTPGFTWTLRPADDGLLCGPCAVARWLRILNLVVTRPSHGDIGQALKKAIPGTSLAARRICAVRPGGDDATLGVPLLPPIDQWGYVPFPVQRLTPHSLSRRVRDLLSGDLSARRTLTVDPEHAAEPTKPISVSQRVVHGELDRRRVWDRRRADLRHLADVNEELTDVERRADELNRRAMALLDTESSSQQPGNDRNSHGNL